MWKYCFLGAILLFVIGIKVSSDGGDVVPYVLWMIAFFTLGIILAIYSMVKATVKAVGAVVEFVGDVISCTIDGIIDLFTVKEEIKNKVPDAFKFMVQEKMKTSIKVGIFDKKDSPISQLEISSDIGVSDDLMVGIKYTI